MPILNVYDTEDYHRIAIAIEFLRAHHPDQPDLATVAQHIGLSESHCQRLFSQWAGISPKRCLQQLTVEDAKSKIAQTKSFLELTAEVGLSSPGRLHDLFVNLEAMSPGEYKSGGAGLIIRYGIHDTPFGWVVMAVTDRGICNLYFLETADQSLAERLLRKAWSHAEIIFNPSATQALLARIFTPKNSINRKPLMLWVKGTNFQIQVWRALLTIPFAETTTYNAIAKQIDRPTAARAVGNAVGHNPIAYLIPCHRVIRESGELGGYHWGLDRKRQLLAWETHLLPEGTIQSHLVS